MEDPDRTLDELVRRMSERHRFGIKLGLEATLELLRRFGDPHFTFAALHVAGTNGKGSVAALLESMLRHAGLRTGLYTSPHLVRLNERFAVNGAPIGDAALRALLAETERHAEAVEAALGREPTFFECTTAMGFEHFRREGVQVAVVEVGMGGRLDSTNILTPAVSVITRISLEHTQYLGPDIPSIAAEKGGIIKPGRPVVCGATPEEARAVLERLARERGAPFTYAPERVSVQLVSESLEGQKVKVESANASYGTMRLPLAGRHQLENLATAVAAFETFQDAVGAAFDRSVAVRGVAAVRWPGRLQILERDPLLVVDGAHNPGAANVLAQNLRRLSGGHPLGLVYGMCGDKDAESYLREFAGLAARLWVVPIRSDRNTPAVALVAAARAAGIEAESRATLAEGVAAAKDWARHKGGVLCATGSLFLVGEMMELMPGMTE